MKDYLIRSASQEDLDQIVELCALHAAYERSSYYPEGKKEQLGELLFASKPNLFMLVVAEGEELIGYAAVTKQISTWNANHYMYLDCLYMKDRARSKGIGAELMDQVKEVTRQERCDLIQWQTPDFNVRAIKFYKRIGAKALQKERFFWKVD